MQSDEILIKAAGIANSFGAHKVHEDLSFSIRRGEILGIVGGSGSGKSVLLHTLVGLRVPNAGNVWIKGRGVETLSPPEKASLMGVLFQHGALFSSLTVLQNVMAPIVEHFRLPEKEAAALAKLKISLANLPPDAAYKYPSELSGGMIKRASLARAMALDPEVLFLDEPTSGLDPIAANEFDMLVKSLNHDLGITFVIITHDLDTLATLCHRVGVLVERKLLVDTLPGLLVSEHPWIKSYFRGDRARAVFGKVGNGTQ